MTTSELIEASVMSAALGGVLGLIAALTWQNLSLRRRLARSTPTAVLDEAQLTRGFARLLSALGGPTDALRGSPATIRAAVDATAASRGLKLRWPRLGPPTSAWGGAAIEFDEQEVFFLSGETDGVDIFVDIWVRDGRGGHAHRRIAHRVDATSPTNMAEAMEAVRAQLGPAIDVALRESIAPSPDFSAISRLIDGGCPRLVFTDRAIREPTGGLPRWRATWRAVDATATAVDVAVTPRRGTVTLTLRRGVDFLATSHYGPTTSMFGLGGPEALAILMRNFVATRGAAIVAHLNHMPLDVSALDDPLDPPQAPRDASGYRIPPEAEIFADFATAEAAIRVGRMAPSSPSKAAAEVMARRRGAAAAAPPPAAA